MDGLGLASAVFDPDDFIETFPVMNLSSGSAIGSSGGFVAILPIRSRPLLAAKARVWVDTTGNNIDVGLLSFDGITLTLVDSSGSTAIGGAGEQVITMLSPHRMQPGVRYASVVTIDGATGKLGKHGNSGYSPSKVGPGFVAGNKNTAFPLATNFTSVAISGLSAQAYRFWVRFSET